MAEALLAIKAVHIGAGNHSCVCIYILYIFAAFIWCCHHTAALAMAGLPMKVGSVFN